MYFAFLQKLIVSRTDDVTFSPAEACHLTSEPSSEKRHSPAHSNASEDAGDLAGLMNDVIMQSSVGKLSFEE